MESNQNMNPNENQNPTSYAGALKCIFKVPKGVLSGAFCAIVRAKDEKLVELIFWTTKLRSPSEIDSSFAWEIFSTQIPEIGQMDKESCDKLKKIVSEKLSSDEIAKLFADGVGEFFESELKKLFEGFLHYEVELSLVFETFDQERLKTSGYERESQSDGANAEVKMSDIVKDGIDTTQDIICIGKIDPVNGIPASKLTQGDLLEVTVPNGTPAGKMIADYYANKGEEPAFPVEKVEPTGIGSFMITLQAGGGLRCIVKTTGDIKLKGIKSSPAGEGIFGLGQKGMMLGGAIALSIIAILIALIIKILR